MAQLKLKFFSKELKEEVKVQVIIPTVTFKTMFKYNPPRLVAKPLKTLWLLHGFGGNYRDFFAFTGIERIAGDLEYAAIGVEGKHSHYTDMAQGKKFMSFIESELWDCLSGLLPISRRPEDNILIGVSMGGYGAMKIGLINPEKFASIVSMSGGLDRDLVCKKVQKSMKLNNKPQGMYKYCNVQNLRETFGHEMEVKDSYHDLFFLAKNSRDKCGKTNIYLYCGLEDGNLEVNKQMYRHLEDMGYSVSLTLDHGDHDWSYWEGVLYQFLQEVAGHTKISK